MVYAPYYPKEAVLTKAGNINDIHSKKTKQNKKGINFLKRCKSLKIIKQNQNFFLRWHHIYCLHRQSRQPAACNQQQMGFQMFSGSCVTPCNLHDKSKNITRQSQSWWWQLLNNDNTLYLDMALFFTISYHPSDLWMAPDSRRNLFCHLSLICSGEDYTCVHYF